MTSREARRARSPRSPRPSGPSGPSGGAELEVTPTAMVAGGRAIARDEDGRVVLVAGALPGERVHVLVESEHRGYRTACVEAVIEPSAHRVVPPCPELARGCGGCQWQHVDAEGQRAFKREIVLDALRRIGRIDPVPPVVTTELDAWAYRTTIRADVSNGRAGLRRARSHDAVAVDGCLVAHPLLVPLLTDVRYPGAREVLLRCGSRTGERCAVTTPARRARDLPAGVRQDAVHEHAAGRTWRISARSFFQSRPDGADALAELVGAAAGELGTPGTALDLYSGVGLFAGVLADRGWTVTAVESARSAVADARENLRADAVNVVRADVTSWPAHPAGFVVADPSRAGLGRGGVHTVVASGANRLVLVSCDAASLGRDAALLGAAGYTPTAITLVDLFPQTFHVEAVTVFDR